MDMRANKSVSRRRDYFDLFQLEPAYDIDLDDLTRRFHKLQKQFHPDLFSDGSATERRVAAQVSAEVNAGFDTLRDPVRRAGFLLERMGVDLEKAERQPVDGGFLLEQMELRERIQMLDTADATAVETLQAEAKQLNDSETMVFTEALETGDLGRASRAWVHLLYLAKLRQDIVRELGEH